VRARRITKFSDFFRDQQKRFMVLYGGSGGGKSHGVAQHLIQKFYTEKDKRFLVTRKTLPSLKISAYKLIKDLLQEYNLPYEENKSDLVIYNRENEMLFKGLDEPKKIRSYESNYIWTEEPSEDAYKDFTHMKLSLRRHTDTVNQMFLSFNPVSRMHWLHKEFVEDFNGMNTAVLHSTYKDNPFLDENVVNDLIDLEEKDAMYYRIYTLGEWGVLENIIYTNYDIIPESEWPDSFDEIIYGVDFGYNAPSAILEIGFKDMVPYERELLYKTKLTNRKLIQEMDELGLDRERFMFADSGEPARIQEIADEGYNCWPAKKGHDSVTKGIDVVKSARAKLLNTSTNLIKEKQTYKYKEDKDGNVFDTPVKFRDHLMDCERMARYTYDEEMVGSGQGVVTC